MQTTIAGKTTLLRLAEILFTVMRTVRSRNSVRNCKLKKIAPVVDVRMTMIQKSRLGQLRFFFAR